MQKSVFKIFLNFVFFLSLSFTIFANIDNYYLDFSSTKSTDSTTGAELIFNKRVKNLEEGELTDYLEINSKDKVIFDLYIKNTGKIDIDKIEIFEDILNCDKYEITNLKRNESKNIQCYLEKNQNINNFTSIQATGKYCKDNKCYLYTLKASDDAVLIIVPDKVKTPLPTVIPPSNTLDSDTITSESISSTNDNLLNQQEKIKDTESIISLNELRSNLIVNYNQISVDHFKEQEVLIGTKIIITNNNTTLSNFNLEFPLQDILKEGSIKNISLKGFNLLNEQLLINTSFDAVSDTFLFKDIQLPSGTHTIDILFILEVNNTDINNFFSHNIYFNFKDQSRNIANTLYKIDASIFKKLDNVNLESINSNTAIQTSENTDNSTSSDTFLVTTEKKPSTLVYFFVISFLIVLSLVSVLLYFLLNKVNNKND